MCAQASDFTRFRPVNEQWSCRRRGLDSLARIQKIGNSFSPRPVRPRSGARGGDATARLNREDNPDDFSYQTFQHAARDPIRRVQPKIAA